MTDMGARLWVKKRDVGRLRRVEICIVTCTSEYTVVNEYTRYFS